MALKRTHWSIFSTCFFRRILCLFLRFLIARYHFHFKMLFLVYAVGGKRGFESLRRKYGHCAILKQRLFSPIQPLSPRRTLNQQPQNCNLQIWEPLCKKKNKHQSCFHPPNSWWEICKSTYVSISVQVILVLFNKQEFTIILFFCKRVGQLLQPLGKKINFLWLCKELMGVLCPWGLTSCKTVKQELKETCITTIYSPK